MPDLRDEALVAVARAVATIAHRGQTDKAGQPYIEHPRRVAACVSGAEREAIAWLHDVLEDTDLTRDDLHAAGISWDVILDVERLTRTSGQTVEDYYDGIRQTSAAEAVKLADIRDNTDPARLALLDDETIVRLTRKYAKALQLLTKETE